MEKSEQEQTVEQREANHNHQPAENDVHCLKNDSESDIEEGQSKGTLTYGQEKYINDAHEYLEMCLKDKKIKVMDEQNPVIDHLYLKDISLHKKGPLEDKIYSKNNLYYANIRRGNTLCQIFNENHEEIDLFMCRRGMKKFYDLEPEYLKVNRKLTHQHERYRNRIFENLEKMGVNEKIHLYGIFKENGEHCQVSYVWKVDAWLFASKNVAILVKEQEDLSKYEKERFYWAKLIAEEFFKILGGFSSEKKKEFILDIKDKTLLGEHCGYEKHQHITKYDKIELIFYALVNNNGHDHCLPVNECKKLLDKYGLKMSRVNAVENLSSLNKIYECMYKMLKEVGEGSMEKNGEGSVLYMVSENEEGIQKTVGMCKLKTCEYLIFRRMREMIKIFFAKKGETANGVVKFRYEMERLVEGYFKPPSDLSYYFEIAESAFNEVKNNQKDFSEDEFRYKFVSFLSTIQSTIPLSCSLKSTISPEKPKRILLICPPLLTVEYQQLQSLCKLNSITIEFTYRPTPKQPLTKTTLHLLHLLPRINLDELGEEVLLAVYEGGDTGKLVEQLEAETDLRKAHVITFIKSADKTKSIELLKEKICSFGHQLSTVTPTPTFSYINTNNFQSILNCIPLKSETISLQQTTTNIITIVVPLLIPGSGKSVLGDKLSQNKNVRVISSDKMRAQIMKEYREKSGKLDIDHFDAFGNTKEEALEEYRNTISKAIGTQPPTQSHILYIDRVFCPTNLSSSLFELQTPWTKIILLTQTSIPVRLSEYTYPYSISYLLTCIKRCIEREDHETLDKEPTQIVRVLLKFYQMFRNWGIGKVLKEVGEKGQIGVLEMDFGQADQEDNLHLKRKLEECLKGVIPGYDAPDGPLYGELIELMYKYRQHFEGADKKSENGMEKDLEEKVNEILKVCGFY